MGKVIKSAKEKDIIIIFMLSLITLLTTLPFKAEYLSEWDSGNHALGIKHYDIPHHQPHPPGYILFIGVTKLLNLFFNDANNAMVFVSILLGIFAVILLYILVKQMFSRFMGIVSASLLIFNLMFWFYREIAGSRGTIVFFSVLIAYLSYQVLIGKREFILWSILALGISGGFRADLFVYMFPLWLFCIIYHTKSIRRVMLALAILSFLILALLILSFIYGGLSKESFTWLMGCFSETSIFLGARGKSILIIVLKFIICSFLGINFLGAILILSNLTFLKRVFSPSFLKNKKTIFIIIWVFSPLLLLFIHFAQPSYTLNYTAPLQIIAGYFLVISVSKLQKKFKFNGILSNKNFLILLLVTLNIVINSLFFLKPYRIYTNKEYRNKGWIKKLTYQIDYLITFPTYQRIKIEDNKIESYLEGIKNLYSRPDSILIIYNDATLDWPRLLYYFPDFEIYWPRNSRPMAKNDSEYVEIVLGKDYKQRNAKELIISYPNSEFKYVRIPIGNKIEKIVWLVDEKSKFWDILREKIEIKSKELPHGFRLYYSEITGKPFSFKIQKLIFQR